MMFWTKHLEGIECEQKPSSSGHYGQPMCTTCAVPETSRIHDTKGKGAMPYETGRIHTTMLGSFTTSVTPVHSDEKSYHISLGINTDPASAFDRRTSRGSITLSRQQTWTEISRKNRDRHRQMTNRVENFSGCCETLRQGITQLFSAVWNEEAIATRLSEQSHKAFDTFRKRTD